MNLVNRTAIILRPKQPCIEWADSLGFGSSLVREQDEPDSFSVFLIPTYEMSVDTEAFVDWNFGSIFEQWLEEWCTDPSWWPERRTRTMFHEWFRVEKHSMVYDTVDIPYEVEE